MFKIDKYSQTPIYEQIIGEVERLVLLGLLRPGGQLPSVRTLSQELSVNPNTLQKAYSELERRGISQSVPGTGRFIAPEAAELLTGEAKKNLLPELEDLLKRLALSGVSYETVLAVAGDAYSRAGKGEEK